MSKKWIVSIASLACVAMFNTSINYVHAEGEIVQYEEDGRVKPITVADELSESELNEALSAIGLDTYDINGMSKADKVAVASEGGRAIDLEEVNTKTYYNSLDGTKTEYNEENKELIDKKKRDDLKTYNELTGKNQSLKDSSSVLGLQSSLQSRLPGRGISVVQNGKIDVGMTVVYLGTDSNNIKYGYHVAANVGNTAFSGTDMLGLAWSEDGIAKANTAYGTHFEEFTIVNGSGGKDYKLQEKNLPIQGSKLYGHYVKADLTSSLAQTIITGREVNISKRKAGDPAAVIASYYHHHISFSGSLSASIGPASITFSDKVLSSGDTIDVEYSFNYGDK